MSRRTQSTIVRAYNHRRQVIRREKRGNERKKNRLPSRLEVEGRMALLRDNEIRLERRQSCTGRDYTRTEGEEAIRRQNNRRAADVSHRAVRTIYIYDAYLRVAKTS